MIENQFFDDKKGALFTGLRNTLAVVEGQKRGSLTVEYPFLEDRMSLVLYKELISLT